MLRGLRWQGCWRLGLFRAKVCNRMLLERPGVPAAAASTAPSPAAPGTNTVAPLAPQQSGQFNFGDDQAPINDLQLRPDQSVPTWVRIIFKEVEKPKADDGKT